MTPEELEAWCQEQQKKIKPLPAWYFESGIPPRTRMKEKVTL
jgi:hypothetical protein